MKSNTNYIEEYENVVSDAMELQKKIINYLFLSE